MPKLVTLVTVMAIVFSIAAGFTVLAVRARAHRRYSRRAHARRRIRSRPGAAQFAAVACMRHCYCGIGEPGRVPLKKRRGGFRPRSVASRVAGAASRARKRVSGGEEDGEEAQASVSGDGSGE